MYILRFTLIVNQCQPQDELGIEMQIWTSYIPRDDPYNWVITREKLSSPQELHSLDSSSDLHHYNFTSLLFVASHSTFCNALVRTCKQMQIGYIHKERKEVGKII